MDNCILYKKNGVNSGLPGRIITYFSICEEVKRKRFQEEEKKKKNNDFPFFSNLIGQVSHEGVIHGYWGFLGRCNS